MKRSPYWISVYGSRSIMGPIGHHIFVEPPDPALPEMGGCYSDVRDRTVRVPIGKGLEVIFHTIAESPAQGWLDLGFGSG